MLRASTTARADVRTATTHMVEKVSKMVNGGGMKQPRWLHAARAVPPEPVRLTKRAPPKIEYPEDAMRRRYYRVFGKKDVIHDMLDPNHENECERFIRIQKSFMGRGLDEDQAFKETKADMERDRAIKQQGSETVVAGQAASAGVKSRHSMLNKLLSQLKESVQENNNNNNQNNSNSGEEAGSNNNNDSHDGSR